MKRFVFACLIATSLAGCAPSPGPMHMSGMPDMDRMQQKQDLMQKMMGDPQVPSWYGEREKITLAMGDRVFDKEFDRVFDSVTVALATLGANVNNMERQSGYITSASSGAGRCTSFAPAGRGTAAGANACRTEPTGRRPARAARHGHTRSGNHVNYR